MSRPEAKTASHAYWAEPLSALFERLGTSEAGLTRAEAQVHLQTHGPNRLTPVHGGPIGEAVVSQLRNPLLWLLFLASIVGATVGERTDALIILAILLLGSLLTIVQESRAGRALEQLGQRVALRARVLRDGQEAEVLATSVVPGDILILSAGTLISADAVLLLARDLYVGEAALTGEAFAVEKYPGEVPLNTPLVARLNVVHLGTNVRSGTGRALVVATGPHSEFGRVAGRLALRPPETEFQQGLRQFGYLLLRLMVVLVFVVFGASAWRHHAPVDALLFAVALAIGLAPEMLPAVLATMLARGARRMSLRGVLVRRLEAIENLGNMDVLCTDKTGTLTEGEISLEKTTDPLGRPSDRVMRLAFWNASLQGGIVNPLDRAVVAAWPASEPGTGPELPEKIDEIPFDFLRKRLSVALKPLGEEALLVTKGAAEPVIKVCSFVRAADGSALPLEADLRETIESRLAAWSSDGIRVIGVATRPWRLGLPATRESERNLVFEGFATFRDLPKANIGLALQDLRDLGIRLKVISGDHHAVVAHLSAQIGMGNSSVVRGSEIADLRDEALWNVAERSDLFAEIDPTQKERLVLALKKTGHVVGFMGDGINDASALHAADVGISVDGATDVAREAADFVLLKRDLDTVRDGIKEGRATFANTLKYVLTTESANLGNMLSMAFAALFLPFLPLLAHQILLNNLLSDVPSTALGSDRVDAEMIRKPQHWDVAFIRRFMIFFGLISALFDGITFLILTQAFDATPEEFRSAWFAESLLTELLVLLVLRTRRRCWKSRPHGMLLGLTLIIATLTFALLLSPVRSAFGFVEISPVLWCFVLGIAMAYVVVIEAVKRPILDHLDRAAAAQKTKPHRRLPAHHVWPR